MKPSPSALGHCHPSPVEQLLLRAALLDGEEAITAWQAWITAVDLSNVNPGSYRLLPLLYDNLNRLGV